MHKLIKSDLFKIPFSQEDVNIRIKLRNARSLSSEISLPLEKGE